MVMLISSCGKFMYFIPPYGNADPELCYIYVYRVMVMLVPSNGLYFACSHTVLYYSIVCGHAYPKL